MEYVCAAAGGCAAAPARGRRRRRQLRLAGQLRVRQAAGAGGGEGRARRPLRVEAADEGALTISRCRCLNRSCIAMSEGDKRHDLSVERLHELLGEACVACAHVLALRRLELFQLQLWMRHGARWPTASHHPGRTQQR